MFGLNRYSPYWLILVFWLTEHDWGPYFYLKQRGGSEFIAEDPSKKMCHRCGKVVEV